MRSEQSMLEIRKELKQKVNKSEFLEGMGSKLSLSDATNLSFDFAHKDSSMKHLKDAFHHE
jgi:ubiquinone/menaquinone biosynthesis C-methylase UbiE